MKKISGDKMRDRQRDIRLLVRVAQMYYEEGANQAEIAEKLGISKATTSRILTEAREEGIVTITVNNPIAHGYIGIEKEMEIRFGLKEVILIETNAEKPEDLRKELAKAGAKYLQRVIKTGQTIGVSMGHLLKELPSFVENYRTNKITFIPLLGGIGQTNIELHPNQIALELAKKFKAEYKLLHAPAIVDNFQVKELFTKDRYVQSILEMGEKVDIGLFGIGSPLINTSTLLESGYYSAEEIETLRREGAVGDICSQFVDAYGNGEQFEFNKRIIGIPLEKIREIPLAIGIAGHLERKEAILSVLRGNYIDVLIIDQLTAKAIIELDKKQRK